MALLGSRPLLVAARRQKASSGSTGESADPTGAQQLQAGKRIQLHEPTRRMAYGKASRIQYAAVPPGDDRS